MEYYRRKKKHSLKQVNESNDISFKTGDKVSIKGGGKGEITSIDSNNQKIDVLLEDGTTKSYNLDQIESEEGNIDNKEEKNKNKAEGIEDDKKVNNKE